MTGACSLSISLWSEARRAGSVVAGGGAAIKALESVFEAPSNFSDNYGQRMRALLLPPATGNYVFWIASDDNAELWLGTNDVPANQRLIAFVSGWTSAREWNKYSPQKSAAISLSALLFAIVALLLVAPRFLPAGLAITTLLFIVIESFLRGAFIHTVSEVTALLAVIAAIILFLHFWFWILIAVLLGGATFLLFQRLRELAG